VAAVSSNVGAVIALVVAWGEAEAWPMSGMRRQRSEGWEYCVVLGIVAAVVLAVQWMRGML